VGICCYRSEYILKLSNKTITAILTPVLYFVTVTIKVTFKNPDIDGLENGSVTVEDIGEDLFDQSGGNLSDMGEEDKTEYQEFLMDITPKAAIEEALNIIAAAPAFDHISVNEIDQENTSITVEFTDLHRQ